MTEDIEREAMSALRGAQYAKESFTKILNMGSPSISDLAYAVKSRIKDDHKIIEKVLKKRGGDKPHYRVNDIRDIVGIRIVTLYRLDALNIIPILIDRIRSASGVEDSSVLLPDPVEEVIIYSVNPEGDAQKLAGRIASVFGDRGYGEKTKIETSPQNYSSTHIVVWARGLWSGKFLQIPIEIQIRTALEDVWSEIEHKLKYKRESKRNLDFEDTARIENCLAHLRVMKTLNDGLAQYGDQVKIQIDEIDEGIRRESRLRLAEEPTKRLERFPEFSGELKDVVQGVLGKTREILDMNNIDASQDGKKIALLRSVEKAISDAKADDRIKTDNIELKEELSYVFEMESALVLYFLGQSFGLSSGNADLVKAREIYAAMEQAYPRRGIIPYRLARVLYALNERELAIEKMNSLVDRYEEYDLDATHWVHASAYRILGAWHWDSVTKIRDMTAAERSEAETQEFLQACRSAVHFSRVASGINVEDSAAPNEVPHESPRVMAISNLIFFAVHYIEGGGDWSDLGEAVTDLTAFSQYVSQVAQFDEDEPADFHKLNTLRLAFRLLGDAERAKKFARLAISNLEGAGFHDRGGKSVEEHVLRECRQALAAA
jgi:ppGpp synthetase/RelA/SpoT-type nucleotidyltranferase